MLRLQEITLIIRFIWLATNGSNLKKLAPKKSNWRKWWRKKKILARTLQSIFTYQSDQASVFLESGVTVLNHFLLTKFLQAGTVIFLFIFSDSVFTARQDYYTHFESSIVMWGENRRSPRKTTWPPASRTWLVSHVTQARLGSTAVRWQAI